MNLREIKDWVNSLPDEFLEYDTVVCEEGKLNEEYFYRSDEPILRLDIDEENKEILFFTKLIDEDN